jgi:hypothetical protein
MEIAATIWLLIKWLLLIAAASGLLIGLIALFHPLRFNLHLRGTLRGQRAELWFVYFFRIFKIGIVASPHTQDVVLQIFFWQKVLQRNQRPRPQKPEPPPQDFPTAPRADHFSESSDTKEQNEAATAQTPESATGKPEKEQKSSEENIIEKKSGMEGVEASPEPGEASSEPEISVSEPEKLNPDPGKTLTEVTSAAEITEEKDPEKTEDTHEPQEPAPASPEEKSQAKSVSAESATAKIEKIDAIDPFSEKSDSPKDSSGESATRESSRGERDSWRKRLRLLRKRIAEKYRQGKKWLRLFGRKYKLLSPIFWKFYRRSRKGFRIDSPALLCRYALHEPYLTGMCQGNLAIFSGMLQRFGIDFVPVPVFTGPTFYSKAKASLVLMPWRFVFAVFALFFEKVLWQEAWKLFKWYRARKSVSTT